jgi:hypothetical protein
MNINEVADTGAAEAAAGSTAFSFEPRFGKSFFGAFLAAFSTTSSTEAGVFSAAAFLATGTFFAIGSFLAAGAFLAVIPFEPSEASAASFLETLARVGFLAAVSAAGAFESSFFTISGALQAA